MGRFFDSRVMADDGLLTIWLATAEALEVKVVMRKTWMTWKAKYHVWHCCSTSETVTAPASFAKTIRVSKKFG